jgi:hypothetical protein
MKDSAFSNTGTLPSAGANNNTLSFDFAPETTGFVTNNWRIGFFQVGMAAIPNFTNTTATVTLTLQDSTDNSNFANTQPLIQVSVVGVANGPAAQTLKVPLPPNVRRYVRFNQAATANATTSSTTVTYDLVV